MVKWKTCTGMEYGLRTVAFVADYAEYATDVAEFWQCGMPTFVSHGTLTVWNGSVRLERNYAAILERNDERGHVHGRPGKTCRMMLSRECANDDGCWLPDNLIRDWLNLFVLTKGNYSL